MRKSFEIELVLYPIAVFVSINQTDRQIYKDLKKRFGEDETLKEIKFNKTLSLDNFCEASFTLFTSNIAIFRFREKPQYDIIVHECFHATAQIMRRIGQSLSIDSEESYAYLNHYLFNKLRKGMK